MRVLYVAAEVYPLVKTGGLGDVSAALPPALIRQGQDVRLLLPGLPAIMAGVADLKQVATFTTALAAGPVTLLRGRLPDGDVPAYVIHAPLLYDRPGNPYLAPDGRDWQDNHRRFALLGWVAAQLAAGQADGGWKPHIVHGHDWHAGLAPAYMTAQADTRVGSVFTIHNLAYQGLFPYPVFPELGLPPPFFSMEGMEFYGQVSFMKAGLIYSDRITTVSPTYAREIRSLPQGCGLEGVINARAHVLSGILNGVDYALWNPVTDTALAKKYTADKPAGKAACKAALQTEMGLQPQPDALLFAVVSRLSAQKGLDLVLAALPELVRQGGQLALLGSGDAALEQAFRDAAAQHPGAVAVRIGYDETFSHRMMAGADVILVPSRFEPCGLTQMYGLRYGTLPLVRRVGGLADTVRDAGDSAENRNGATGFVFDEASAHGLLGAAKRAFDTYRNRKSWLAMMRRAMAENFSWDEAAQHYVTLYRGLRPEVVTGDRRVNRV